MTTKPPPAAEVPVELTLTITTHSLTAFMHHARPYILRMMPGPIEGPVGLTVDVDIVCSAQQLYALGLKMGAHSLMPAQLPVRVHDGRGPG